MQITSISLTNFRCFGPTAQRIPLSDLAALVGTNASGKSAVLHALQRLFGSTNRDLCEDDFHIPRVSNPNDATPATRTLTIEVRLDFPELAGANAPLDAVAECFRQMVVDQPGGTPFCIVRLEGEWTATGAGEGVIEQHTYWVRPAESGGTEVKQEMRAADRARIQLHYVPAARDPSRHLRQVSGAVVTRLLKAVKWSAGVDAKVITASNEIQAAFSAEDSVKVIQQSLSVSWAALHDSKIYSAVMLRPVSNRFEDLLRQIEAVFSPSPGGSEDPLERLSDGQRSLFYLAIMAAAFDVEDRVSSASLDCFEPGKLLPASLTIFAIEEPENHVAPHYLGSIMDVLRKISKSARAQVILTSHSPSIVHRVQPEEIRHLRLHATAHTTLVNSVVLPAEADVAHKFVREAVRAFPELYFAKIVVLGEGDSEEIVLPRLAEAFGMPIDRSFVSIVPLGGRHVNHMWRLLNTLGIPHVTLLDLDRERIGGGWGRIKYAITELMAIGTPPAELLFVEDGQGSRRTLNNNEFEAMHTWILDASINGWISNLERFNVFFSQPLDLDFLMLHHYSAAYHATAGPIGPDIPAQGAADYVSKHASVAKAVLKESGGNGQTYSPAEQTAFFWYRYLFLNRSKPVTHLSALAGQSIEQLRTACPPVLRRLLDGAKSRLGLVIEEENAY